MAVSSVSSTSYSGSYIAQVSSLERNLVKLDKAIDGGDTSTASATLKAIMKANPQYAASSSSDSSSSSSSSSTSTINSQFTALATALDKGDKTASTKAWDELKATLTKAGVSTDGNNTSTQKILSQIQLQNQQSLITALMGDSSSSSAGSLIGSSSSDMGNLTTSLLGASSTSNKSSTVNSNSSLSDILSSWLTYKSSGTVSKTSTSSGSGSLLDENA